MENIFECTGHILKIPNIVDSNGIYIFDADGKRYMDLESGVWCTSLGHKNIRVTMRSKNKSIASSSEIDIRYSQNPLKSSNRHSRVARIQRFSGFVKKLDPRFYEDDAFCKRLILYEL